MLAACGGAEPRQGQSFTFGWILLGVLGLFLLLLFVGLIRYVKAGHKKPDPLHTGAGPSEFKFDDTGDEDDDGPPAPSRG
jgi:hypothetical protein